MEKRGMERDNEYKPSEVRIVRKYDLAPEIRYFQIRSEDGLLDYKPGQFLMLSSPGVGEAPFSISSSPTRPGMLELCIRKAGTLTSHLFSLKENDSVFIRGPYGNGFPTEDMKGHNLLFIAGGLGIAPLRSVLLYALDRRDKYGDIYFLYGAKTPNDLLFKADMEEFIKRDDIRCHLTVDSDPSGRWKHDTGMVTNLFKYMKDLDPTNTYALVCGPPIMYQFVIKGLLNFPFPMHQILMTLERRMKCGIGKCGHCVINERYTCIDGPVFDYWDVMHTKGLVEGVE